MDYPVFGIKYNIRSTSPLVERLTPGTDPHGYVNITPGDTSEWYDQFPLFDVARDGYGKLPEFYAHSTVEGGVWFLYASQGEVDGFVKYCGSGVSVGKPVLWSTPELKIAYGDEAQIFRHPANGKPTMSFAIHNAISVLNTIRSGTVSNHNYPWAV